MPKKALTAASVERIKPPAKGQVDIFDQGYPGLALRVSYGGGKTWAFFYRLRRQAQKNVARHLPCPVSIGRS